MSSNHVIRVKHIGKVYRIFEKPQDRLKQGLVGKRKQYYKDFWALRDVSLDVFKGETVGIIGKNGSGKSTLLEIIAGTLKPTYGEVIVQGRIAALLELGSGFNPEFTGLENVYMNASILGLERQETDALLDEILSFAEIGEFIYQPVKTYSSGMAVRLAFSVQAMVPKDVLIVDEALAVGDELFQRKCFAKIEEFKQQGGTILFVSHSGGTITELCDRALLLDRGEPILLGPSKKVVTLYQKLMYAPPEKRELIREDILTSYNLDIDNGSVILNAGETLRKGVGLSEYKRENSKRESMEKPLYDPYLIPRETVRYERQGARIYNPEIVTMGGEKVNLLISGQQYIWRYQVEFERACVNVRFGMLIKTPNGMEMGGGVTALPGEGVALIEYGCIINVEFFFTPNLNVGLYFVNGGVLEFDDGEEIFLDRGIDLVAFRVIHNSNLLATANIDFGISSEVRQIGMAKITGVSEG